MTLGVLVLFGAAATAQAQHSDGPSERKSLAGMKQVAVMVEDLREDIQKDGLHDYDLRTDAELALRKAGLRVISMHENNALPGSPYLYYRVSSTYSERTLQYSFAVEVNLIQQVVTEREPKISIPAVTWSLIGVGYVGKYNLQTIRSTGSDLLNMFVNAWLAANGK
jgi:hypothetical protein